MGQSEQALELTYFIAEKGSVLVVSFVGSLNRESPLVLEKCLGEILAKPAADAVILHFREVPDQLCGSILPTFARLQKAIRAKPAQLRLSGLRPTPKKFLIDQGLVRLEELANNVSDALESLSKPF